MSKTKRKLVYKSDKQLWGAFDRRGRLMRYEGGNPVLFNARSSVALHVRLTHTNPKRKPWGTVRRVKVTVEAYGPEYLVRD